MTRRHFLKTGAALALTARATALEPPGERALALHRECGVFDAYTKPILKLAKAGFAPGKFIEHVESMQAGLWHLREGNVRMCNMSVGVPRYHLASSTDQNALKSMSVCNVDEQVRMVVRQLDALFQSAERQPNELGIARTVGEAEKQNAEGKLSLFLHLTGAYIANDLAVLRSYRRMGVVSIHPCIEGHHDIGDSANEVRLHGGLTALGKDVVREMNRQNMVVDVAHGSDESIRDMLSLSTAPVIYSHGGCKALCDVPRNLSDERLQAIAKNGGVACIVFVSGMLSQEARQKGGRADPRYQEEFNRSENELFDRLKDPYAYLEQRSDGTFMPGVYRRLGWPEGGPLAAAANHADLERVVDHIEHAAKVAGIDHVGLGSDYEAGDFPTGLEHAGKLPNLTGALLRRGFSEGDVRKVLIGNVQRVYREVLGS